MSRHEVWREFEAQGERLTERFAGLYRQSGFLYEQPRRLQAGVPARLRKPYVVPVAYTDWGAADAPLVVCVGGVANTAMRFAFLAADLCARYRVVCMDWLGRGRSGWLADEREYASATYVEQLRQLLAHLRPAAPAALLGSSLGGSAALALAAQQPALVGRLLLNDVGPAMPAARRRRRAETLARFHVFASPAELARRLGAAQKHDGPVSPEIRQFLAYHQTRWSEENAGRVYRHDPRAMLAYRRDAQQGLDQWDDWAALREDLPLLLLHGMESDALSPRTLARMGRQHPRLAIAHIPATGHTPALSDRHQTALIRAWLDGALPLDVRLSVPHAGPREPWR